MDSSGFLDEIVASNAQLHLERMDDHAWWMAIELPSGERIRVWIQATVQCGVEAVADLESE